MPGHYRPLPVKSYNAVCKSLSRLGLNGAEIDAESIFNKALKSTGYGGDRDYSELRQRLNIICKGLNESANLHPAGKLLTKLSLFNSIKNRIQIDNWLAEHTDISSRPVEKPVFILGLPRTGTTALFNMLAHIDDVRAPLGWEINKPIPPVTYANRHSDPRIKQTHREFEAFFYLTPELRVIHDFGALLPQECIAITQYDLFTGQFWFCYDIPDYLAWYKDYNPLASLQFHKSFNQLLQSDFPIQQWLFKTPFHLPAIEQLLAVYPDARIIQTHRDPMEVMGSVCSFAWHLRSTFSDKVDSLSIGKEQMDFWSHSLDESVAIRDKMKDKASQFYDVDYRAFVENPLEIVSGILEFLGKENTAQTRNKLIEHVERNQKDKHGKHAYNLEDYGLDKDKDKLVFSNYCNKFSL